MSIGVRRTLVAASLAVGVGLAVVVVATRSAVAPATVVATGSRSTQPATPAVVTGGRVVASDTPATATTTTTTVTTVPLATSSTTRVSPPTAPPRLATTTSTAPTAAPPAPPTGRLAVTLAVPNAGGGAGVGGGIATMSADGSGRRVLVAGNYFNPEWTPDGRLVLFDSSSGPSARFAVPAAGGTPVQLAPAVVGPLSPDGTRVLQQSGATTPPTITVQPVLETATGLVANGPVTSLGVQGYDPIWSPDGRRVLYAAQLGPIADLEVVDVDGRDHRDLLASAPVKAVLTSPPGFSADGSTVAFVGSDNQAYFVAAGAGGGTGAADLRPALPAAVPGVSVPGAFFIAWSPDHLRLAVLTDGANSVVVVDTAGRVQAVVRLPASGAPLPIAFDGSGQYIYFMGFPRGGPPGAQNLYSVALAGGAGYELATGGSVLAAPSVLP